MSQGQNDGQEKTLEASEQKLKKAREKGDIPTSTELHTVMLYLGIAAALVLVAGLTAQGLASVFTAMYERPQGTATAILAPRASPLRLWLVQTLGVTILPLFILPALFVLLSLIAQRSIIFAPSKIKPKLSKLSPLANAKKKYGAGGLGEFSKSFAKLCLIAVTTSLFFSRELGTLPAYSWLSAKTLPELLAQQTLQLLLYIGIGAALIAAIDFPAKWFAFQRKMRMSIQDAKDERKESEGDPYQKQRRRQKAEEIAKTTMLQDVTGASVVIVNPQHYAVALKWDKQAETAPKCVAKGVDNMAFRIRERAKLAGVAIYENPPTARALYAQTEIGETIAPEHYTAVAAAIHYAEQFSKKEI